MTTWKLITLQCKMELLRMVRNPYYIFWSLAMPILFYFIFTRVVNTGPTIRTMAGPLSHVDGVLQCHGHRHHVARHSPRAERVQGWAVYMGNAASWQRVFLWQNVCADGYASALHPRHFVAGYLINGVPHLRTMVAQRTLDSDRIRPVSCHRYLDWIHETGRHGSGVSNGIYLGLAVTGGMWFPIEAMPSIMQAIGKWMPSYHFGGGAWSIVRGEAPGLDNFMVLAGYLAVFMLLSTYIRKTTSRLRG